MTPNLQNRVEEHRAAVLLGMPLADLRRFSRDNGLGHLEDSHPGQQMVFTYEELRRLFRRLPFGPPHSLPPSPGLSPHRHPGLFFAA
jgi:hypothetical protein